jgi:guanosine-3',5'-bis(diphosphate) 3'-pyrophosphohydrolase
MTRQELDKRLQEQMNNSFVANGVALVEHARQYANQMHADQKYGDEPYTVHLEHVESILIEYNHVSSLLRAAAWLHDLEDIFKLDTEENREIFHEAFIKEFGQNYGLLFLIVEALTSEPGKNRKERNKATYVKIAKYIEAVTVKLADRLANGRKSKANDSGKFAMYKKEYPEFRAALYNADVEWLLPMWEELDQLFK